MQKQSLRLAVGGSDLEVPGAPCDLVELYATFSRFFSLALKAVEKSNEDLESYSAPSLGCENMLSSWLFSAKIDLWGGGGCEREREPTRQVQAARQNLRNAG